MSNFDGLEYRVAFLEAGVLELTATKASLVPHTLEGEDNGLYARLGSVAHRLGYRVEDDNSITEVLPYGVLGQNDRADTIMVKPGTPLQMSATLAHELGHDFTPPIYDTYSRIFAEVVAEGTAFIVCDHHELDTSPQSFRYIARHRKDGLTEGMKESVREASATILEHLQETA